MAKRHVLVAAHDRLESMRARLAERFGDSLALIREPGELTFALLETFDPRYVFFPHWSHRIPAEIHENFECVIFHMADVPYGRGGSPLQNLIARGIYETKMTALRCVAELDAGPVYLKRPFSLYGTAEEILLRASDLIEEMVVEMIEEAPIPVPQEGDPVVFRRRKPVDGNIGELASLDKVHDFIRMLDAEGYPPAFADIGGFRLEFTRPSRKPDAVLADVRITKIGEVDG